MSTPIPRIPASKYPQQNGAFPVRFRIKGEKDGPVFAGQTEVRPCPTCGSKSLDSIIYRSPTNQYTSAEP